MFRDATVALALILGTLGASAQSRMTMSGGHGAGHPKPPVIGPPAHPGLIGLSGRAFGRRAGRGSFLGSPFLGTWPYFSPDYYDYADYSDAYQMQTAPPAPLPQPPPLKPEALPPVLLELQGNQWVRVSGFQSATGETPRQAEAVEVKPLPPAVLIFRDGHREEVSSYSIIGPVLYAKGDYWATGSWTRSIQISDLNVPATLKENQ